MAGEVDITHHTKEERLGLVRAGCEAGIEGPFMPVWRPALPGGAPPRTEVRLSLVRSPSMSRRDDGRAAAAELS